MSGSSFEASLPETERLAIVNELELLYSPPEESFDRIVRLVQNIFDIPIALVSLMDANRQWHKACVGLPRESVDRQHSFCRVPVESGVPLIVPDATLDPRFAVNAFVAGDPFIRFYAGIPLRIAPGAVVGTLCAIDRKPRPFTERDFAILRDLARIAEDEIELRRHADVDVLTDALSRRAFKQLGGRLVQVQPSRHSPVSAIMLDIDHFKAINDTYGHAVGDTVLTAIAARCRAQLRGNDLFGRLGGEEFAILLPQTGSDGAMVVAEKLRQSIRETPIVAGDNQLHVTASFGIATAEMNFPSLDHLLAAADSALYGAKASGRDRVAHAA